MSSRFRNTTVVTSFAVALVMMFTACEDPAAPMVDAGRRFEPMLSMNGIPNGPLVIVCWTGGQVGDTAFLRASADGDTLLSLEHEPEPYLVPSPDSVDVTHALPHVEAEGQCTVPWTQETTPFDPDPTTVIVTQFGATGLQTDSVVVDEPFTAGQSLKLPPDTTVALSMSPANAVAVVFYHNRPAQQDTSRPAIPDTIPLPERDTTTLFRGTADTSALIYPDIVAIAFDDSTSGTTVQTILGETGDIVGGRKGSLPLYFVQIPTPANSLVELDSLRAAISARPGVAVVLRSYYRLRPRLRGRFPSDGALLSRDELLSEVVD